MGAGLWMLAQCPLESQVAFLPTIPTQLPMPWPLIPPQELFPLANIFRSHDIGMHLDHMTLQEHLFI